jgi:cell wall-associated NlpC family hydrolase
MLLIDYIGIPYVSKGRSFKGCDCWGLVYLYYKHEYNIELPTYTSWYIDVENLSVLDYTVNTNKNKDYILVDKPQVGDIVLFRIKGYVVHCGVYIGNGEFLHNFFGTNSCIERLDSVKWNKRVEGFYRYEENRK